MGDRTFIPTSQRDISERKAVEAELGRYRINLEQLVEQRTRELNDRTAQLDTIFASEPRWHGVFLTAKAKWLL